MNHADFLRYQAESVKRASMPPAASASGRSAMDGLSLSTENQSAPG